MPQATYGDHKPGHGPIITFVIVVLCAIPVLAVVDFFALVNLQVITGNCDSPCPIDVEGRSNRLILLAKLSGAVALAGLLLTTTLPRRIRRHVGLTTLAGAVALQVAALDAASVSMPGT
ncbi:hypothetical protein [Embleya sp. AB8]|uniref:hypothetical protein n=1 Tax=Embleya sp. AB8 TaxID=3156304 RepID=UPI003C7373E6